MLNLKNVKIISEAGSEMCGQRVCPLLFFLFYLTIEMGILIFLPSVTRAVPVVGI